MAPRPGKMLQRNNELCEQEEASYRTPGRTRRGPRGPPPRLPEAASTRRGRPARQSGAGSSGSRAPAGSAVPAEPANGPAGEGRLTARTRERYAAIHELLRAGESLHAISRVLSLSRPAVRRFARAASVDELLAEATGRESKLDPFRPYICQRWNEGLTDAAALHAELRQRGFTGSVRTVRRYVAPFWQAATVPDPARQRQGQADYPLAAHPP